MNCNTYIHVHVVSRGKRQWKAYYAYLKGFLLYFAPVSTQIHVYIYIYIYIYNNYACMYILMKAVTYMYVAYTRVFLPLT